MDTYRKRLIRHPLMYLTVIGLIGATIISIWNIWFGLAYLLFYSIAVIYAWKIEKITFINTEKHIESLSFRMKK